MKRLFLALIVLGLVACSLIFTKPPISIPGMVTVYAQTLPYALTVTWTASPDGVTYNCKLDGVQVATGTQAGLTCAFPVTTLGAHTVSVTTVNPAFVPPESAPATLTFTLKQPVAPTSVRVK